VRNGINIPSGNNELEESFSVLWQINFFNRIGRKAAAAHLSGKLNTGIPSGGIVWRVQWIGG